METRSNNRWHQEPYVWLIISIPAASVLVGAIMLFLAINSDDGLVVDDYYKHGLEINRTLHRDHFASANSLEAKIQFNEQTKSVNVILNSISGFEYPAKIRLGLYHATRGGFDHDVDLVRTGDRVFSGDFDGLFDGRWYVHLSTEDWRLTDAITWPQRSATLSSTGAR